MSSQPPPSSNKPPRVRTKRNTNPNPKPKQSNQQPTGGKLRGLEKDSPEVRISKTLSWLLRHGAQGEGLAMRKDGYVKLGDLLQHPKLKSQGLDLEKIQEIVGKDSKQRYDLICEPDTAGATSSSAGASTGVPSVDSGVWYIRARQGHSLKTVQLDLKPILSAADIPTGVAVHGTTSIAWESISKQGLSKMKRNHIHLAQGLPGHDGVISGMRSTSQIFIYINVQSALNAGLLFFFSDNGVILTSGDDKGFLKPEFFSRVENARRQPVPGWEGAGPVVASLKSVSNLTARKGVECGYDAPSVQKATVDERPIEEGISRLQVE